MNGIMNKWQFQSYKRRMLCEIDGFAKNVTFDRNTHLLQDNLIELK